MSFKVEESLEILKKLVKWGKDYPSSYIYSHEEIIKIAAEIDSICDEAKKVIETYNKRKESLWTIFNDEPPVKQDWYWVATSWGGTLVLFWDKSKSVFVSDGCNACAEVYPPEKVLVYMKFEKPKFQKAEVQA